jgi:hypothetical protein
MIRVSLKKSRRKKKILESNEIVNSSSELKSSEIENIRINQRINGRSLLF